MILLVALSVFIFSIYAELICWNVPYGERTGICALINNR